MKHFKKYVSLKQILLFLIITLIFSCLILLSDEGKRPLTYIGNELITTTGSREHDYVYTDDTISSYGTFAKTKSYVLKKGSYTIGIQYFSNTQNNFFSIINNGILIDRVELSPTGQYIEHTFTLEKDSQEIYVNFEFGGVSSVFVHKFILTPATRFYNDAFFYLIVFLFTALLFVIFYFINAIKPVNETSIYIGLLLIIIGFLAQFPYLNGVLPWGDDICYHLLRIEGIKDGLLDGQFPVLIYPEGLEGHGYLNCMYPNLFLYIPALIRCFGVSLATSYKFLIFIFNIATAFISYYSIKTFVSSKKVAICGALLYTLSPYRFTNLYARGALGEALAMTFMPLLVAGLYHVVLGNKKKWPLLAIAMSGFIQTHVLSAVIGGFLCILCGLLYLVSLFKEKRFGAILKCILTVAFLNLWFFVPFLHFYNKGNLQTDSLYWSTFYEYSLNFSSLAGTLTRGDYRVMSFGLPIAFCAAISLLYFAFLKNRTRIQGYCLFLCIVGCACTLMVIGQFPSTELMNISFINKLFKTLQFPWRLLGPASLLFVLTGCYSLLHFKYTKVYSTTFIIVLSFVTLLGALRFKEVDYAYINWPTNSTYSLGHENKIIGILKSESTILYPHEWRPNNTLPQSISIHEPIASDLNAVTLSNYSRKGTTSKISYTCNKKEQYLEFPIINYLGYEAYDENNQSIQIINGTSNAVRIPLIEDGQTHTITLKYKGHPFYILSFVISTISFILLCAFLIYKRKKIRKD